MAVVIPAYQQPGLLAEAILSTLAQSEPSYVIVVIDGCPMPETHESAACFARAYPGQVHVIRQENGGLSAARNAGIDFVLASWSDVEAVMFLDADNRMAPDFLARALRSLKDAPSEVGWVYPDIDMIGLDESSAMGGEFSRLALIDWNYCDAGSVTRRALLEHGLRFDETMRSGFEDWDFWLQAIEAGFVGRHLPNAGFGYRRRGESMIASASRRRESLVDTLRRKRPNMLRPRRLLEWEAVDTPRFALILAGADEARFVSDPLALGRRFALAQAAALWREAHAAPGAGRFPAYCVFLDEDALAVMAQARIAASIFWLAQKRLRKASRVRVFLRQGERLETRIEEANGDAGAAAIFVRAGGGAAGPSVDFLVVLPPGAPLAPPRAAVVEAVFTAALQAASAPTPRSWRRDVRPARNDLLGIYERLCGCGAMLPMLRPKTSRGEIGFVIPVHAFGGVEKVVTSHARVLRRLGYRAHLFVTSGASFLPTPDTLEAFASINLALTPEFDRSLPGYDYFGAPMSGFERDGDAEARADMLGLLAVMDVVIDTQSPGAYGLAGRLRALGVVTLTGLHLVDRDAQGAPVGLPHSALAYEHAYDRFLVISEDLRRWCIAHGVPEDKILLVPNAPSYPARAPNLRAERQPGPLRALFLGRLDAQKGLDRLAAIVAATRTTIEWRVIGKAVLDANASATAPAPAPALGVEPEAPLHDPEALDAAYDWADVLALPSRYEGAPLTILEARRRGVVTLATHVGAVAEVIGAGGYLVEAREEEEIVAAFVARLTALADDPDLLATRARATLADPPAEVEETIEALADFLGRAIK